MADFMFRYIKWSILNFLITYKPELHIFNIILIEKTPKSLFLKIIKKLS